MPRRGVDSLDKDKPLRRCPFRSDQAASDAKLFKQGLRNFNTGGCNNYGIEWRQIEQALHAIAKRQPHPVDKFQRHEMGACMFVTATDPFNTLHFFYQLCPYSRLIAAS